MLDKKSAIKDYIIYSGGNYISQALGMLTGFLVRIFLDPYYVGIWQGLSIVKSYTSYSNLGVTKAAAREIAYYRGKGLKYETDKIKDICFTFSFFIVLCIGIILFATAMYFRKSLDPVIFWGMLMMSCIVILERLESLMVSLLRAYKRFDVESISKIISSLANVVLILLLVRTFKIYGYYVTHVLVFIISIAVLWKLSSFKFSIRMDKNELKELIKVGVPLVLLGLMFTNLTNVDRIVVIKMLGAEQLGLYSIALMLGNLVFGVTNMAGIVLYPRFQEVYGKSDKREDVFHIMTGILRFVWLPTLAFTVAAIIVFPFVIKWMIPKYIGGIDSMRIFLMGTFFLSLSLFCGHFLVTINKQKYSLFICGATIVLNLVLNILFVRIGWGIEGVAIATSISYFAYFIGLYGAAAFLRKDPIRISEGNGKS